MEITSFPAVMFAIILSGDTTEEEHGHVSDTHTHTSIRYRDVIGGKSESTAFLCLCVGVWKVKTWLRLGLCHLFVVVAIRIKGQWNALCIEYNVNDCLAQVTKCQVKLKKLKDRYNV